MKKKTVIAWKNLPMRMPLGFTALWALVLDRLSAPGWAWGAFGVFVLLVWIVWIIDIVQREHREIWPEGDTGRKSRFQERLENLQRGQDKN